MNNWSWLERPTTTVYDTLMAVVSRHLDKAALLRERKDKLINGIDEFYKHHYDTFEGRNVNPTALVAREAALEKFLLDALQ
jgi:hypothetical protein